MRGEGVTMVDVWRWCGPFGWSVLAGGSWYERNSISSADSTGANFEGQLYPPSHSSFETVLFKILTPTLLQHEKKPNPNRCTCCHHSHVWQFSMKQSLGVNQTGLNVLILIFNQSQTSCLLQLSVLLPTNWCSVHSYSYETHPGDLGAEVKYNTVFSVVFNDLQIRLVVVLLP